MARKRSSNTTARKRTSSKSTTRTGSKSRKSTHSTSLLQLSRHQWAIIGGMALIALSGVSILSGLSISQGKLTDWLWTTIWKLFGYGGIAIPLLAGLVGLYLVLWGMEQPPRIRWSRMIGATLLFVALEGALHLLYLARHPAVTPLDLDALQEGGGYLGGGLVSLLEPATGRVGVLLLCLAMVGAGLIMISGLTFAQFRLKTVEVVRAWRERLRQKATAPAVSLQHPPRSTPSAPQPATEAVTPSAPSGMPQSASQGAEPPLELTEPGLFYGDVVTMAAADYKWQLPAIADILEPGTENSAADAFIREQVEIIEHTLASFGAPSRVVEINPGPVITQFGVEPLYIDQRNGRRVKVKVGQINSLADDLALALAARSIRIQAPVPGRGYVGIEVPNAQVSIVSLRDVMESKPFTKLTSPLRIGLGQDVSGNAIAVDLGQMPHLLVAGTTGSGKSVCVNSIVTCLLLNNSPDKMRLLMVDPKRVELTGYNGIPHLLTPVIVDLDKVVGTLQWVTREMDSRYRRFAEIGARNLTDYNQQADSAGKDPLPFIVVVIDELADLMLMAPDEIERTVCRLAQMARATGIHLVIATQRPSVDVVTGLIKANFPARIAFAVASSTDSRVILDSTGAERLLGRGDMLLMTPDSAQPARMQGCFVSDRELHRLVDFWRRQRLAAVQAGKAAREKQEEGIPATPPAASPLQQPLWEELAQAEQAASEEDELLDEAIAIVRELGRASVSLLQRRLRIGYTRAARLVDEMEIRGIVGPHPGGSRQREVLPPPEEKSGEAEPTRLLATRLDV
jgi:DNA segregation ATPase FtsK/SpoIIIE, S-DNA-T family